jgi:hypothetical protein
MFKDATLAVAGKAAQNCAFPDARQVALARLAAQSRQDLLVSNALDGSHVLVCALKQDRWCQPGTQTSSVLANTNRVWANISAGAAASDGACTTLLLPTRTGRSRRPRFRVRQSSWERQFVHKRYSHKCTWLNIFRCGSSLVLLHFWQCLYILGSR